jgi:hypothetical protein
MGQEQEPEMFVGFVRVEGPAAIETGEVDEPGAAILCQVGGELMVVRTRDCDRVVDPVQVVTDVPNARVERCHNGDVMAQRFKAGGQGAGDIPQAPGLRIRRYLR